MNKKQLTHKDHLSAYNRAVKSAYFAILEIARQLLSTIEREELRFTHEREDRCEPVGILHELVNPLLYLRLECYKDNKLWLHFGFEPVTAYLHITAAFSRAVYRLTAKEHTAVNIEDCIRTDRFIYNPDQMFEHIDEESKFHIFFLIPYNSPADSRKQMQAAT